MSCALCSGNKISDWKDSELGGLKYLREVMKSICEEHAPSVDERLKGFREPKIYTLKPEPPKPKPFIPKQVQVKPDWTEREPGEEG